MAEHRCTFTDCSLPAPVVRAEMERLRRVNADLVEAIEIAIDRLETVIAGADVCANCVDVAIRNMRAALRSATETPGGGSDVSPVSDGSNRDSKPSRHRDRRASLFVLVLRIRRLPDLSRLGNASLVASVAATR